MHFLSSFLFLQCFFLSVFPKLEMVLEVFRHGAREPIFNYWNAALFKNPEELTSVGMRQHFLLGTELRREYIENSQFLSPNYDPKEIYVRSSNFNRTIMSALSQLSGLYPLGTGPTVPADVGIEKTYPPYPNIDYDVKKLGNFSIIGGFQPIPVHSVAQSEDRVFLGGNADVCEINKEMFDEQKRSDFYKTIIEEFENNTLATLRSLLNITNTINLDVVTGVNDVFINDIFANKPLPNLSEEFFRNMTYMYTMNLFYTYYGTWAQRKFITTPIFHDFLSHFQSKIQNTTTKKWIMYSGHDSTLGYIYSGLNISNYECLLQLWRHNSTDHVNCEPYPAYASSLIIELHQNELKEFVVKMKVNGIYINVCDRIGQECSWEEFSRRLEEFAVPNYEELCNNQILEKRNGGFLETEENSTSYYPLGILIVLILANLMLMFHLRRNN